MFGMKYYTELVLLFFVLSCSVLASSVHGAGAVKDTGGPAVAQQQDKAEIPEKNKQLAKEAMAISAQMQDLAKQLEAASKVHDLSKIKELAVQYQSLEDQINATLKQIPVTKVTRGQLDSSGPKTIPKDLVVGASQNFGLHGGKIGCDWNWNWASGSGKVITGTNKMYLFVNTSPTVSDGLWPFCKTAGFSGFVEVEAEDLWTGLVDETSGSTYTGSTILDYVNQQFYLLPGKPGFVPGHPYQVDVYFHYWNGDMLIAQGGFIA